VLIHSLEDVKTEEHAKQIIGQVKPDYVTDDGPSGRVWPGKTGAGGKVARADVADVAVRMLERDDTRGWYDLLSGSEDVGTAVERLVSEKVNCVEGEDVDVRIKKFIL
jgi:hypothetical protein